MNILAENKYGTGGIHQPIRNYLQRKLRPVGGATVPFDWNQGIDVEAKIGTIPVKNQFQSSSCGGQAKSYLLGAISSLVNPQPYKEVSAKSIYSPIFIPGGGATLWDIESDRGATDEEIVLSQQNGNASESFMESKSWMNSTNIALLAQKQGYQAINVDIDIDSIAEAIRDYGGVIMLITGSNNGTWTSDSPQFPTSGQITWNHFMYGCGAFMRNGVKTIKFMQSWGDQVGDKGRQYFTETYINSGYIRDIFAVQKVQKFIFNQNLSFGMLNNDVKELQKRLNVFPQTGFFGLITSSAVKKYQTVNGLPSTGFVGILTRAKLNN